MGTHPIFESDFDCLTDWAKRRITPPGSTTRTVSSTPFQSLTGSTTGQLVGPAFMIYSATKESVIISVLSQAIEFAALAARECSQIFDSGRKYPGKRQSNKSRRLLEQLQPVICNVTFQIRVQITRQASIYMII